MGKILALDVGLVRTGVAVSDSGRTLAFARDFLTSDQDLLSKILSLVEQEGVNLVLVGQALHTDNTKICSQLTAKMQINLVDAGLQVIGLDERYTTKMAMGSFHATGVKNKDFRKYIDSESARIILEQYLATL